MKQELTEPIHHSVWFMFSYYKKRWYQDVKGDFVPLSRFISGTYPDTSFSNMILVVAADLRYIE